MGTAEFSSITEFPLVHPCLQKLIERLNKNLSEVEIHKTQQELERGYCLAGDVVGYGRFSDRFTLQKAPVWGFINRKRVKQ